MGGKRILKVFLYGVRSDRYRQCISIRTNNVALQDAIKNTDQRLQGWDRVHRPGYGRVRILDYDISAQSPIFGPLWECLKMKGMTREQIVLAFFGLAKEPKEPKPEPSRRIQLIERRRAQVARLERRLRMMTKMLSTRLKKAKRSLKALEKAEANRGVES